MSRLVLLSPASGAGKTTVSLMIANKLGGAQLARLGDDGNAPADAALFGRLSRSDGVDLAEAPGGDAQAASDRRGIVVADANIEPGELRAFSSSVGERLAGVILNRVPARRRDRVVAACETQGLSVLLDIPEDRALATPTLNEVAEALHATTAFFDSNGERAMGEAVIASISADPGQGYFLRHDAKSVIVRSDKPDLQLAALNAGATCLIVTGALPLLGYVKERAEADEIPLIRTDLDTGEAVRSIEALYAGGPFSGSPEKLSRLAELTQSFDATKLLYA